MAEPDLSFKTHRFRAERCYVRTAKGDEMVKRKEGATPRTLKLMALCDESRIFSDLKAEMDMPSEDLELWLADLCNRGLLEPGVARRR
ncbi:MAG: hypothetical protein ACKVQQ_03505 [Burkholderiales bacterium]